MSVRQERRSIRASWQRLRPFLGSSSRGVFLLGATAILGGFVEAALMVVIVRLAVGLAAGDQAISTSLGPLGKASLSMSQLFAMAAGLVLGRLAFNAANSWLTARLATEALTRTRRSTFAAFVRTSWTVQAAERDGHLQELMSTHVSRVAQAALTLAACTVAGFNFVALMISAVLVSPIAAMSIVVGVVILFFGLRPISRAAVGGPRPTPQPTCASAGPSPRA